MSFIEPPWDSDPEEFIADALDYLVANIPGWVAHEGNIEVWMIEALGHMVANARDVGSSVPKSIFRYFGKTLLNLPPIEAVAATTNTTWTAINNAGYTIEAGTLVGIRRTGDVLEPFEVVTEVVIPPGSLTTSAGQVQIRALNEGKDANVLGGAVELIDSLAWVSGIATIATTTGGVDAETDDDYLDRLSSELQLLSPRPILPGDFAVIAKRIAGVHRALAIDGYEPPEAVPNVTRANASNVLNSALVGFVAEDVGRTVTGTGIPAGTTITAWNSATQVVMSANATSSGTETVTMGERTNRERMVTVALVDSAGQPVSAAIRTAVLAMLEAEREVNFVVHAIDPTYTIVNVNFTITVRPEFVKATTVAAAQTAVTNYLNPGTWAGGGEKPPVWRLEAVVRHLEMAHVIYQVAGVDDVTALTINGAAADLALPGRAPLPQAGAIVGVAA